VPQDCVVALVEHGFRQWRPFHAIRTSSMYVDDGRVALSNRCNNAAIDSVELQRDIHSYPLQRLQLSVLWAPAQIRPESSDHNRTGNHRAGEVINESGEENVHNRKGIPRSEKSLLCAKTVTLRLNFPVLRTRGYTTSEILFLAFLPRISEQAR